MIYIKNNLCIWSILAWKIIIKINKVTAISKNWTVISKNLVTSFFYRKVLFLNGEWNFFYKMYFFNKFLIQNLDISIFKIKNSILNIFFALIIAKKTNF